MNESHFTVQVDPSYRGPTPGRAVLADGTELEVVDSTPTLAEVEAQGLITVTGRPE